jgi:hypothetical protein
MYGDIIESFVRGVIMVAVFAVIVVAVIAFFIGRGCAPTPESIKRQEQRQAVIDSLTPEQREALGL